MYYSVSDVGTSTLGSYTEVGVLTGGSGAGGGAVQHCRVSATFSKTLRGVSPDFKPLVINDGGLVRSEMIFMAVL